MKRAACRLKSAGADSERARRILSRFWDKDSIEYQGEFYRLVNVSVKPRPVQTPHPPLMVGSWGSGDYRVIARSADGWMASASNISPEDLKAKSNLLLAYRRESRGATTQDSRPLS